MFQLLAKFSCMQEILDFFYVAKYARALSCGNVLSPDRKFSVNYVLLANDRLLFDESSVAGVRIVKEAVSMYDSVINIPKKDLPLL